MRELNHFAAKTISQITSNPPFPSSDSENLEKIFAEHLTSDEKNEIIFIYKQTPQGKQGIEVTKWLDSRGRTHFAVLAVWFRGKRDCAIEWDNGQWQGDEQVHFAMTAYAHQWLKRLHLEFKQI